MRIATTQFQSTLNRSLGINQTMAAKLTEMMANGTRMLVPSDDPVTNVRLSRLTREEAALTQYRDNISAVNIRLAKNESYLQGIVTDVTAAHDQMVWAAEGTNTPADLQSMVNPLKALQESILYSANVRDSEGNYLFSGTMTDVAPMAYDPAQPLGSRYTYAGNLQLQRVVVGDGITQPANTPLDGLQDMLNALDVAIDGLETATTTASEPILAGKLKAALDALSAGLNLVTSKIADSGGAQNVIKTLDGNHANVSLSNKTAMHDLASLDYGMASVELAGYNMALRATYQSYAKISDLSLFNVL